MAKRQVMLTFTTELLVEPITYNLGQQFNLVINILRAEVTEDGGWLILELEGEDKDIDDGITFGQASKKVYPPPGTDHIQCLFLGLTRRTGYYDHFRTSPFSFF